MKKNKKPVIKRHKGSKKELEDWCKKYGLEYEEHPCECGGVYKMNVIYQKDKKYYGLESSPCETCKKHTRRKLIYQKIKN